MDRILFLASRDGSGDSNRLTALRHPQGLTHTPNRLQRLPFKKEINKQIIYSCQRLFHMNSKSDGVLRYMGRRQNHRQTDGLSKKQMTKDRQSRKG